MGENDAERAVDRVIVRSLSPLATSRRSKHKMWIAGPISKEKEYKWGRCKTVNKRSDVIKIGDRPLVGHDAQSWAFVAVCGAKKLHILERPWCKDIKHRCSLMKLPWLFINPLQKNAKKGKEEDGVGCQYAKTVACSYGFHLAGCSPRCSRMQFSNHRFVLQRHFSS
jgi:hypothetical protein